MSMYSFSFLVVIAFCSNSFYYSNQVCVLSLLRESKDFFFSFILWKEMLFIERRSGSGFYLCVNPDPVKAMGPDFCNPAARLAQSNL